MRVHRKPNTLFSFRESYSCHLFIQKTVAWFVHRSLVFVLMYRCEIPVSNFQLGFCNLTRGRARHLIRRFWKSILYSASNEKNMLVIEVSLFRGTLWEGGLAKFKPCLLYGVVTRRQATLVHARVRKYVSSE